LDLRGGEGSNGEMVKIMGFIKGGEYLDQLTEYLFLNNFKFALLLICALSQDGK
jgi:hypothetical protein